MYKKLIGTMAAAAFAIAALGAPTLANEDYTLPDAACFGQQVAYEATTYGPGYIGKLITWALDAIPGQGNADVVAIYQDPMWCDPEHWPPKEMPLP